MGDIWNAIKDLLLGAGLVTLAGFGATFLANLVKKGDFKNWGIAAGKWLSALGSKANKQAWEKIEDSVIIAFISFAQGLKEGADWDDNDVAAVKVAKGHTDTTPTV